MESVAFASLVHLEQGNLGRAISSLEDVLHLDEPTSVFATVISYTNLACVYATLGAVERALVLG